MVKAKTTLTDTRPVKGSRGHTRTYGKPKPRKYYSGLTADDLGKMVRSPERLARFVDQKEREVLEGFAILRAEHGLDSENKVIMSPKKPSPTLARFFPRQPRVPTAAASSSAGPGSSTDPLPPPTTSGSVKTRRAARRTVTPSSPSYTPSRDLTTPPRN